MRLALPLCVRECVCGLHMIMYLCMNVHVHVRVRVVVCATYSDHPIGNFALMLCNQLQASSHLTSPRLGLGLVKAHEL